MFKNLIVYELPQDLKLTRESIEQAVSSMPYIKCKPSDMSTVGFVPHVKSSESKFFEYDGSFVLNILKEEKVLPAAVIKEFLDEKISAFEEVNGRKPKKTEKDRMKDEVIFDLLPKAFSKYAKTTVWIDTKNNRVIFEAGSEKRAEDAAAVIRKALGSFPITPLKVEHSSELIMTKWVSEQSTPPEIVLCDEVELTSTLDESVVTSRKQSLQNEEILLHIENSKFVSKIAISFEERVTLTLTSDLHIKKLKFSDIVSEEIKDNLGDSEGAEEKYTAEFLIYSEEINKLIEAIIKIFNE